MPKDPWDTPAMRQYRRFKDEHPDCVLFFRMGDFYEMFGEDAERLAPALGLRLSKRGSPIPMAGVPHHQKDTYLRRAIEQGFRVAVCDQIQDPKDAKGVVDRAVTQVVTPGTLVDESLLEGEQVAALASVIFASDEACAACVVELSTGEVTLTSGAPEAVAGDLARRAVREILYAETTGDAPPARVASLAEPLGAHTTPRPAWHFRDAESREAITEQYRVNSVEGFGVSNDDPALPALGAALRYLAQTQGVGRDTANATSGSEFQSQASTLAHLRPPRREESGRLCTLDTTSLRALEIERTLRTGEVRGSLLGVFLEGRAMRTPMGRRLIRAWLCEPLARGDEVRARQSAVAAMVSDRTAAAALGEALSGLGDIARIAGRLALGRLSPRDLVSVSAAIARMDPLRDTLASTPALAPQLETLDRLAAGLRPLGEAIETACVEDPPASLREGGLIRDGVDAQLDEARGLQRDAGAWLSAYQTRLIEQHDLPSLKVGYNKVFGYYIELPSAQAKRAPAELTRKQTLKNAERFITPELREFENKVTTAESRALARERELFDDLVARAFPQVDRLQELSDTLAHLDALLVLADKAHQRGWTRPEIRDEPVLEIHAGRHPVLDELLESRFVPNDAVLGMESDPPRLALITGPNMAGKSTYIRQNALLVLLASIGSFIPAQRATIGVCDRIFTRVGADDALHRGQSTFMVEMTETAVILNNATERSLVILDEIGRGTSTLDGLSLAWAIAESLATDAAPRTFFATHYHEITELGERLPDRVRNLHVSVREWTAPDEHNPNGRPEIIFLHRILPGPTDQSYGVHVARLAGLPEGVTDRAREILQSVSVQHAQQIDTGAIRPPVQANAQLPLFTEYLPHPAIDRLREIKLDALSPLEAFDALRDIKAQAESPGA
jgi:DNA mismatch repair protein MutS